MSSSNSSDSSSLPRKRLSDAKLLDSAINRREGTASRHAQVSTFWKSAFSTLNKKRRRSIILNHWGMPMAARNLAARSIQSALRGFLLRSGQRVHHSNARDAKSMNDQMESSSKDEDCFGLSIYADDMERWYGTFTEGPLQALAASKIQSMYRMRRCRRRFFWNKFRFYQIAATEIQYIWKAWRMYRKLKQEKTYTSLEQGAVSIVQRWLRRQRDKSIYRALRDVVVSCSAVSSRELLRRLRPSDEAARDISSKVFVRLRLSGTTFPPAIYFKTFTRSPVCDVNAFAPRNYASEREQGATVTRSADNQEYVIRVGRAYVRARCDGVDISDGYERFENNGWQRVDTSHLDSPSAAMMDEETTSPPKERKVPVLRSLNEILRKKKKKRREWLRKIYSARNNNPEKCDSDNGDDDKHGDPFSSSNPDEILKWAGGLDFDSYMSSWGSIGASECAVDPGE